MRFKLQGNVYGNAEVTGIPSIYTTWLLFLLKVVSIILTEFTEISSQYWIENMLLSPAAVEEINPLKERQDVPGEER